VENSDANAPAERRRWYSRLAFWRKRQTGRQPVEVPSATNVRAPARAPPASLRPPVPL